MTSEKSPSKLGILAPPKPLIARLHSRISSGALDRMFVIQPEHVLSMLTGPESVSNGSHSLVLFCLNDVAWWLSLTIAISRIGRDVYRGVL